MEKNSETPLIKLKAEMKAKKRNEKRRRVRRLFKIVFRIVLVILTITVLVQYDRSSYSKINEITIKGLENLTETEVLEQAQLELNQRIYLKFGPMIKSKISDSPYVDKASVSINYLKQSVSIEIDEVNYIAYMVSEGETILITEYGDFKSLENSNQIMNLPSISGYSKDEIDLLVRELNKIDESIYGSISEMIRKPVSYDNSQIELFMSNGIRVTSDLVGLELLTSKYYYDVVNRLNDDNKCILIDSYTRTMVASPCDVTEP